MSQRTLGCVLWVLIRAVVLGCFLATHAVAQESVAQAGLPSSQELETQHAKIGAIRIVNNDVFATDTPEENKALFRLANYLHLETHPQVIERQLLFKSGDSYSDRVLRESERILRSKRYFYDATITPVAYRDGVVDIEVRTRDVWTFKPGINFGRQGGKNSSGFEVQESNLLGYGKEVTVARRNNVDRTSSELRYYDPQLGGTWNRLLASYSENSDGRTRVMWAERPFYSLDTRWAANVNALDWQRTDQRYNLGHVVDEFRHDQQRYELGGGWSDGWRAGWVRRIHFGVNYSRDRFTPTNTTLSAQVLPADRTLAYPYVGFTLLQDDFEERRNQNQIERTEDLYAGTFIQGTLGVAQPVWGADRSAWLLTLAGGTSYESEGRTHTVVLASNAAGRIEAGAMRNALVNGDATYYWRVSAQQLFYATLRGAASEKLDGERQLLLGGDSGLRGYPLRYQDGTAQALLTLEHRVYTQYHLFRLFHLGGAVFFDIGRAWGTGNGSRNAVPSTIQSNQGLLKDVGLGLRFGSSRSAFGNVIHVDLAFPLDGDSSIKRTQFVVETKQSF